MSIAPDASARAAWQAARASARDWIGTVVAGRYRIDACIGGGGMGIVYRAEHLGLGASFALKLLRPELADQPEVVRRFARESHAAARVASEHVVAIVDSGSLEDGVPFLVMPLLTGLDLRALLTKSGCLPPLRAVNLALDACRGLAAAHAHGLVHRDLKPANLFVTRGDDGRDVVKIIDFGVAKHSDAETTRPGGLVGTVRYMAPEQMGLDVPVGPAADLFALGVILYECLAGAVPFDGDTTERVIYKTMTSNPAPLSERCPALPEGLSDVVARALQKNPSDRYSTALAFADALLPFAGAKRNLQRLITSAPSGATLADGELDALPTAQTVGERSPRRREAYCTPVAALAGALVGAGLILSYPTRSERTRLETGEQVAPTEDVVVMGPVQTEVSIALPAPSAVAGAATGGPPVTSSDAAPESFRPSPFEETSGGKAPATGLGRKRPAVFGHSGPARSARPSVKPSSQPPVTEFDPENPYALP